VTDAHGFAFRGFHALHAANHNQEGIVTFTFHPDDAALADRIDHELRLHASLTGVLIKVVRPPTP
jgi:hypothetical protein